MIDSLPVIRDPLGIEGQDFNGKTFDRNPAQDEEPGVVAYEMEVVFLGSFIPPDKGIPGFDRPCLPGQGTLTGFTRLGHSDRAADPHPKQATGRSWMKAIYLR